MKDDPAEILFQSFLQEAHVSSSGIGRDAHSSMFSSSISSSTYHGVTLFQDDLKDGYVEAVLACDMPEPC